MPNQLSSFKSTISFTPSHDSERRNRCRTLRVHCSRHLPEGLIINQPDNSHMRYFNGDHFHKGHTLVRLRPPEFGLETFKSKQRAISRTGSLGMSRSG